MGKTCTCCYSSLEWIEIKNRRVPIDRKLLDYPWKPSLIVHPPFQDSVSHRTGYGAMSNLKVLGRCSHRMLLRVFDLAQNARRVRERNETGFPTLRSGRAHPSPAT